MKLIDKFLHLILGIVILCCLVIVLCAVSPDVRSVVKGLTAELEKYIQSQNPEEETASSQAASEASSEVISLAEPVVAIVEEIIEEEPAKQETAHPYNFDLVYSDYLNNWDTSAMDTNYLVDPIHMEFIEALAEPVEFGFDDNKGADMLSPQPEIFTIEDEKEAKELSKSLDKGNLGDSLEFDKLYYPYYHMLNDRGKALYRQLCANAISFNTRFAPVLEDATDSEIYSAFVCLLNDHPELFWVDITYYSQYDFDGHVVEFDFDFYDQFTDIPAAIEEFEASADAIVATASGFETDYEKELVLHDLILKKLQYRYGALDQSAYSSVVDDYTVCAGYSKCFQYLCQKLEIPAYYCSGWGGNGRHAWNIVKLDDGFHNVDCTWDDADSNYEFFNINDVDNVRHRRMEFSCYLPKCSSSVYNPKYINISPLATTGNAGTSENP